MSVFGRGKDGVDSGETETIIGPTVKVEGKFVGKGNIVVAGKVSGSMKTDQDIHIDAGAVIQASVDARNVHIAGEVHGNVRVADRFELTETGKLFGDVEARTVSISPGAVLNGKCVMAQQPLNEASTDEEKKESNLQGSKQSKNQRKVELTI